MIFESESLVKRVQLGRAHRWCSPPEEPFPLGSLDRNPHSHQPAFTSHVPASGPLYLMFPLPQTRIPSFLLLSQPRLGTQSPTTALSPSDLGLTDLLWACFLSCKTDDDDDTTTELTENLNN